MLIGCPMDDFAGIDARRAGATDFHPVCNTTCSCDRDKFSPVCGVDGKTYFSACHAGCRNATVVDGKILEVKNLFFNKNSFFQIFLKKNFFYSFQIVFV